jgi:hypothetical protein
LFLNPLPGRCTKRRGQPRFVDKLFHRLAERLDVPGRHKDASASVEQLPDPADISSDTGQTSGHGLKQRQRQVLVQRGQDKRISPPKLGRDVVSVSRELNLSFAPSREVLAALTVSAVPQHYQPQVCTGGGDGAEGRYQQGCCLRWRERPSRGKDPDTTDRLPARWQGHTIVQHPEPVGGHPKLPPEEISHRIGWRDGIPEPASDESVSQEPAAAGQAWPATSQRAAAHPPPGSVIGNTMEGEQYWAIPADGR